MRGILLLVVLVAALGGHASGSTRAADFPGTVDAAPAVDLAPGPAARPGASYLYHLTFELLYEVDWSHASGLEGAAQDPCASWQKDSGSTTLIAQDGPWKRKGEKRPRRHGIPGSITFYGTGQSPTWAQGQWASGSAIGTAVATIRRRWIQKGGPTEPDIANACPDRAGAITPWRATDDDCGNRTFTTKTATFLPQRRKSFLTLDDLMTVPGTPKAADDEVFSITVSPGRDPYKRCLTYDPAPFPLNVGVWIRPDALIDLKDLRPGGQVKGDWKQRGACDADVPKAECTFKIDVEWTIVRVPNGKIVFP